MTPATPLTQLINMKLFLVRHGETEWNRSGKFLGQYDVPLNDRGVSQARDVAKAAISWRPTALYSSPLTRTMQVAEQIGKTVGLTVTPYPGLMELDLGQVEGISGQQMRDEWPQLHQVWSDSPETVAMPGGESLVQLEDRAWASFSRVEQSHKDGDNIVIVSHNFAIRAICGKLLGIPLSHFHRTYLHLSSVCIFDRGRMGWRMLKYNSTGHLSPDNLPD